MEKPGTGKAGSKFKPESAAEAAAEDKAERPYLMEAEAWEQTEGQEFGGASGILDLKAGEVAGIFAYIGHQQITTDLGEATVHTASDEDNVQWRLPIQATFLRAVDQASLKMGDKFAIRRDDDVIKKRGAGKGKPMAIFAIKVIERATVGPVAATA
jgi:hypothetical protein